MRLRQIRYFVTLAETGNFHRAAARLNMSQPPLSVAIRKLEEETGVALFIREPRGVVLTPAGQSALPIARQILASAERFQEVLQQGEAGKRGRLRVGFIGSAVFELLPRVIAEFRHRYPLVELKLEEGNSAELAQKVTAGTLDVALLRLPLTVVAPVVTEVIERDELHVALPAESIFADMPSIALATLKDEPFILQSRVSILHSTALLACHEAGFIPTVAQEAEQLNAVLCLVRSGMGVALVPALAAGSIPEGVRLIPLTRPVAIETGVAFPRDGSVPLAQNFVEVILDRQ